MQQGSISKHLIKMKQGTFASELDWLAVEEPLEIQIAYGKGVARTRKHLAVTMRTPGNDFELALGFLFTEGIITNIMDVIQMRYVADQWDEPAQENSLLVDLHPDVDFDIEKLNRHFYTSSSCGVCGKASIEMLQTTCHYLLPKNAPKISIELLFSLPQKLDQRQTLFTQTGGIHAAALFDLKGNLQFLREDVGRHNALDKLIGAALKAAQVPLYQFIILVSGRAGFELVQKSLMAGAPILAAVGAASSLAVELAETHDMTLVGFLKGEKGNIYSHSARIHSDKNY